MIQIIGILLIKVEDKRDYWLQFSNGMGILIHPNQATTIIKDYPFFEHTESEDFENFKFKPKP